MEAKEGHKSICSIGHSTLTIENFIKVLKAYKIEEIADIRTIPKSRHNPQFNKDSLSKSLKASGVGYVHIQELGGLRHTSRDSVNTAWRNLSFRGFADYMQTEEFESGLKELDSLSKDGRVAIMCAEAVPWRCHRSLIADALTIRGIEVIEIISGKVAKKHVITPWADVKGFRITYPLSNLDLKQTKKSSS